MNNMAKYKLCGGLKTTVSGKLLYLILLEIAGDDNTVIISQRRICAALGLSKSTIRRNLHKLQDSGYIDIQAQYHSDGGRAASKYIVLD